MTKDDIKHLRHQLGWSAAEMARRLALKTEIFLKYETGEFQASDDVLSQLQAISNFVESNAIRVNSTPLVEEMMRDLGVDQIQNNAVLK